MPRFPDVVVLAGGAGTRLRGVDGGAPKVLVPVAGRPWIEHVIDHLLAAGADRIVVAAGWRGDQVAAHLAGRPRLEVVIEPRPLGTAGALALAVETTAAESLLVVNGDSLCRFDARRLAERHDESEADFTLIAAEVHDAADYGTLVLDAKGRVFEFGDRRKPGPDLVNAGVYLIRRAAIARFAVLRPLSLELDVLPPAAAAGRVFALETTVPFHDIGTPERLAAAGRFLETFLP